MILFAFIHTLWLGRTGLSSDLSAVLGNKEGFIKEKSQNRYDSSCIYTEREKNTIKQWNFSSENHLNVVKWLIYGARVSRVYYRFARTNRRKRENKMKQNPHPHESIREVEAGNWAESCKQTAFGWNVVNNLPCLTMRSSRQLLGSYFSQSKCAILTRNRYDHTNKIDIIAWGPKLILHSRCFLCAFISHLLTLGFTPKRVKSNKLSLLKKFAGGFFCRWQTNANCACSRGEEEEKILNNMKHTKNDNNANICHRHLTGENLGDLHISRLWMVATQRSRQKSTTRAIFAHKHTHASSDSNTWAINVFLFRWHLNVGQRVKEIIKYIKPEKDFV